MGKREREKSEHQLFLEANKREAAEEARAMLRRPFVIVDTETTGVYGKKQTGPVKLIQVAAIDSTGRTLLNYLVNPGIPIPATATAINGITDEMVHYMPRFEDIYGHLRYALSGEPWVVYNAAFDRQVIDEECDEAGLLRICPAVHTLRAEGSTDWRRGDVWCAMEAYAQFWGQYHDYFESFTWQRLTSARQRHGIDGGQAHDALADCLATLELVKVMARF